MQSSNRLMSAVPIVPMGGISGVPRGRTLIITMDFEPGEDYVAASRHPFTVPPVRQ